LVVCQNIRQVNVSSSDLLTQEMIPQVDVLHAIMELRVPCNGNHGLIVNAEDGRQGDIDAKFTEEATQLYGFLGSVSDGNVLGFGAQKRD
jgi:hypothetical protein